MAKSPMEIFRDFVMNGVPSSGKHQPSKAEIREYLLWLENQIGSGGGGGGADYSDEIADLYDTTSQLSIDLASETDARIADDKASRFRASGRPGDFSDFFTATFGGAGENIAAVSSGQVVVNSGGAAYRLMHTGPVLLVASRRDMPLEPGVIYATRFALRRNQNTGNPLGDPIEFGIAWLNNAKALIGSATLQTTAITTTSGRVTRQDTISLDQPADVTPPVAARYMRMYVRLYGFSGSTDIEVIDRWETNGLPGTKGDVGDKGWAVEPETVQDGPDRVVLRVADFIGGQGDKPGGIGQFIGPAGLVATAAEAVNIKGNEGAQGQRGVAWRGAWDIGTAYIPGDLVTDPDGSENTATWIALTANEGAKPRESAADWALFPGSFSTTLDDGLISDPVVDDLDDGLISDPA